MCFLAWKTSDADESTGPMAPQTKLGALTIQACESVALRDVPMNVSCEDTSASSSWNSSIPYCLQSKGAQSSENGEKRGREGKRS